MESSFESSLSPRIWNALIVSRQAGYGAYAVKFPVTMNKMRDSSQHIVQSIDRRSRDSVDRIVDVLAAFAFEKQEWRPSELARHLQMPKSTVLYVLQSLARRQMVQREASGSYRLGFFFYKLSAVALGQYSFRDLTLKVLGEAVEASGETAYLSVYQDGELILLEKVDGPHPVRYHPSLRRSRWLHAGAAGKAVLAFLDDAAVENVLSQPLEPLTERTITDPERLRQELAEIRKRGYAVSVGERIDGAAAVGAPVFDADGRVIGSAVISLPAERFDAQKEANLGALIKDTAETLSRVAAVSFRPEASEIVGKSRRKTSFAETKIRKTD